MGSASSAEGREEGHGVRIQLRRTSLVSVLASLTRAEQQKIADCLTSLDEVIAAQGRKVEALKTYKSGLMQQLFPREGETLPRLRFPEFRDAPEWSEVAIADMVIITGHHSRATPQREFYDGKHLFVSPADMT